MIKLVPKPATASAAPRASLSGTAYEALRTRLRRGLVGPQDRLVDLEIAAELGVSRMPVREALLQLVTEGYLVSTARGYRTPTLGRQDIRDVFELRLLLEPRAAALAARDISRSGIARLGAAVAQATAAAAARDFSNFYSANIDFRETWIAAVRNARLAATIARFADQVTAVRHTTLHEPEAQDVALAGLQEMHAGFSRHDSMGVHDAMVRFVLAAERSFLAHADAQADAQSAAARRAAPSTPTRTRRSR